MKFTFFIFFSFIITNVFSYDILKKYGSLITNGHYIVFESGYFSIGDKMYFEISSEYICDKRLYYEYYDDLKSISENKPIFYKEYTSESLVTEDGKTGVPKRYYTIEKDGEELRETYGNYLLLYFDCFGEFKITNTESDGSNQTIIIIIIVICVLVVIAIVITIVCVCLYKKRRQKMMNQMNQMPKNYVSPNGPYYQKQALTYPQKANNNQMIYQNPQFIINSPSNVQIIQNVVVTNAQSSEQLDAAPQAIETPINKI